jgi:hypothetical protein
VYQLAGIVLQQLTKELTPARLAGGQLHHPDPKDDHWRCVMDHHFGVVWGSAHPEVGLDFGYGKATAIEPVKPRLDILSGNHR